MGLFDTIYYDGELPLPEDQGELADHDWTDEPFQTKDLDCCMQHYKISDNQLYKKHIQYQTIPEEERDDKFWSPVMREVSSEWVEDTHTGYVLVGKYIDADKYDYSVDWRVHLVEGKVQGVELIEWSAYCNADRKAQSLKLEQQWQTRRKFQKTFRYRYFYRFWNAGVRGVLRFVRKICAWVSERLWKVQRLLEL